VATAGIGRLGGDLALPSLKADPRTGDFARVTDAKGDAEDANASKPDRLGAVVVDGSLAAWARSVENFGGMGEEVVGALLEEKIFCPLTAANGELVEAYAMNPLCKGKALENHDFLETKHLRTDFKFLVGEGCRGGEGGGVGLLDSRGLSSLSASSRGRLRASLGCCSASPFSEGP